MAKAKDATVPVAHPRQQVGEMPGASLLAAFHHKLERVKLVTKMANILYKKPPLRGEIEVGYLVKVRVHSADAIQRDRVPGVSVFRGWMHDRRSMAQFSAMCRADASYPSLVWCAALWRASVHRVQHYPTVVPLQQAMTLL